MAPRTAWPRSQGLGRATAELFAKRGAAGLVVTGRNAGRGEPTAMELNAGGCKAVIVQADVIDVDACRRVIAYLASDESGMMTAGFLDLDQSVMGGGAPPFPPPMDKWPEVAGVTYA